MFIRFLRYTNKLNTINSIIIPYIVKDKLYWPNDCHMTYNNLDPAVNKSKNSQNPLNNPIIHRE